MRSINTHKSNLANTALSIDVADGPGPGGANHCYIIEGFDSKDNPSSPTDFCTKRLPLVFQHGPIAEVGVNGITHEALLAILIDRLQGFQKGQYACRENALALTKLEEAVHWLNHRTQLREARGVEGTSKI